MCSNKVRSLSLQKIHSGGQTGVDRGALDAALELHFPCGGHCPENRQAEDGIIHPRYPLQELPGGDYEQRTVANVRDSDGTLIIYFGELSGGTELTLRSCLEQCKPYLLIDTCEVSPGRAIERTDYFVRQYQLETLNVAGPRASEQPAAYEYARRVILGLLLDVHAQ